MKSSSRASNFVLGPMSNSHPRRPKSAPHHVNSGARHVLDSLSSWTPCTGERPAMADVRPTSCHALLNALLLHNRGPELPRPSPSLLALSRSRSGRTRARPPWPPPPKLHGHPISALAFPQAPPTSPTPSSIRAAPSHRAISPASLLQLAATGAAVAAAAGVRGRATLGRLRPS